MFIEDSISRQFDRMPPHSIDAEICLLGSLMLCDGDKAAFAETLGLIDHSDFYLTDHEIIFKTIRKMHDGGRKIDAITLTDDLKAAGLYEEIGGQKYIAAMLMKVPAWAHYAGYAETIRATSMIRQGIAASNDFLRNAYRPQENYKTAAEESLNELQAKISKITIGGKTTEVHLLGDVAREVAGRRHLPESERSPRIATGIKTLDKYIGGMRRGGKMIIGGKPGMGKSALLKQFLRNIAGNGVPVGIITVEESRHKVAENALSTESAVPNNRIAFGTATPEECDEIDMAVNRLEELPYFIVDSARKLNRIIGMAGILASQYGCQVIAVDHLHIVDVDHDGGNREREISRISAALKWAWKDLNVAGVEAAQLNRAGGRDRPTLTNLRESGSLEQDADIVLLLHREDYYRRTEGGTMDEVLEVIVAKNKDGAAAVCPVHFDESVQGIRDDDRPNSNPDATDGMFQ